MKKAISLIMTVIMLAVISVNSTGCFEEDPYLDIKFYDKNWDEVYSHIDGKGFASEYEYNGQVQGFHIVLYLNDKVLARKTFDNSNDFNVSVMRIDYYKKNTKPPFADTDPDIGQMARIHPPIIDKGSYSIEADLDVFGGILDEYTTEDGSVTLSCVEILDIGLRPPFGENRCMIIK